MDSTSDPLPDLLQGVTDEDIPVWESASELSRLSVDAFAAQRELGRAFGSFGRMRIVEPGDAPAARLDSVGSLMVTLQKLVSATGGALKGFKSLRGQLTAQVRTLTQLQLTASPVPGSIVLQVQPEQDLSEEIYPEGQVPLTDDALPLLDQSMQALMELLRAGAAAGPGEESADFRSRMVELGPRTATAVRELVTPLYEGGLEVDIQWAIPGRPDVTVRLTSAEAERIAQLVAIEKLDAEEIELVGRLHTISKTKSWDLETDDEEMIRMGKGQLPDEAVRDLHVDQRVRVRAEMTPRRQISGEVTYDYTALSIEPL